MNDKTKASTPTVDPIFKFGVSDTPSVSRSEVIGDKPPTLYPDAPEVSTQISSAQMAILANQGGIDLQYADQDFPDVTDEAGDVLTIPFSLEGLAPPKFSVYLSGGTHSTWREDVKRAIKHLDIEIIDPTDSLLSRTFSAYDNIGLVRDSTALLCNKESDNPGLNSVTELGFAAGMSIPTILVYKPEGRKRHYYDTAVALSDYLYDDLDSGVKQLVELFSLWQASGE